MTGCDVLTFGEAMLRLSPPDRQRIEQAETLDVHVSGAESNVAVALSHMGLRARWLSRLPPDGRGWRVTRSLAAHGVDVSHVRWEAQARVGVFFVEWGVPPRPSAHVIYDRAGSAASHISPDDLPDTLLADCRHLHVTGITPALSSTCAAAVFHAVTRAKQLGKTVSLDVNYRTRLWTPARAAAALAPLLPFVDVLITAAADAHVLWEIGGSGQTVASALRVRFPPPIVAVTLSDGGAVINDGNTVMEVKSVPVLEIVDRLGAGDAFAAGLLTGYLEDGDLARGARLGVAMASLKLTLQGDEFFCTRQEVEGVAAGETVSSVSR